MKFLKEVNKTDFGLKHLKEEERRYYVNTNILLDEFKTYEVNIPKKFYDDFKADNSDNYYKDLLEVHGNGVLQYMGKITGKDPSDFKGYNTYNWGGHISHDIQYWFGCADENDDIENNEFYIGMQVHYGGDIRGRYSNMFLLKFEDYWQYIEAIDEAQRRCEFNIEVDGMTYIVRPQLNSEYLDVYCFDDGEQHDIIYAVNDEDFIAQIREWRNKANENE